MARKTLVKGRKFYLNKVRCKKCGSFLESTDPNEIKYCRCGSIWISGGKDKALRGGELAFTEEHSIYL